MRCSDLQKYILKQCYGVGGRVGRVKFNAYFTDTVDPPSYHKRGLSRVCRGRGGVLHPQKILTHSLESLINKGMLRGYGRRTPKKWFIESVSLTKLGKQAALRCLGEQLPLLRRRNKN